MALLRVELAVLVFLVVELDVVDAGLAEQFVPVVHLLAEGTQYILGVGGLLDYGVVPLVLFAGCVRKDGQVVVQEAGVCGELDHLRVDEHEFQLGRMLRVEQRRDYDVESH